MQVRVSGEERACAGVGGGGVGPGRYEAGGGHTETEGGGRDNTKRV